MTRKFKLLHGAVLLLALVVTSCSDRNEPTGSSPLFDVDVKPYQSMMAPGHTDLVVSAVIDRKGGYLIAPAANSGANSYGYVLVVEANTVKKPTTFTMHIVGGTQYLVDLTATRTQSDGSTLDVGKQLLKPVLLAMSYKDTQSSNFDPSRLLVLYVPTDGSVPQPMQTFVDADNQYVVGYLPHFSQYTMALN